MIGRTQEKQMRENLKGSTARNYYRLKSRSYKKNIKERKPGRKNGDNYTGSLKDLN